MTNEKMWECPRCLRMTPDFPAISRRDNKTKICSSCGQDEALFDFQMHTIKVQGNVDEIVKKVRQEKAWLKRVPQ